MQIIRRMQRSSKLLPSFHLWLVLNQKTRSPTIFHIVGFVCYVSLLLFCFHQLVYQLDGFQDQAVAVCLFVAAFFHVRFE